MACLKPGDAVEGSHFILPVRLDEAALAFEDFVPTLVNADGRPGTVRAVAAIVDKFESCAFEQLHVQSLPDPGGPIVALEGEDSNMAILDSWIAKGTLLDEKGDHCVFVAFMDVMRRPFQGSWTVQTITVLGTKQSVESFLEELSLESVAA